MKQVLLNIPDNEYLAFIKHLKNKFSDIKIKEKRGKEEDEFWEEGTYEAMLLSEKDLAKDWLSEEDNRWDEVL
ncbi:MAG: hypothetical protein JW798_12660 [Prolixibacteraceae bacterium]|nr:hypothetical protein [Prolixibacteraceae bacterium]